MREAARDDDGRPRARFARPRGPYRSASRSRSRTQSEDTPRPRPQATTPRQGVEARQRRLPSRRLRRRRRGVRGARREGRRVARPLFNLGNAYFKESALGPAIWAFERAAALDPRRVDIPLPHRSSAHARLAARQAPRKIEGTRIGPAVIRAVTSLSPPRARRGSSSRSISASSPCSSRGAARATTPAPRWSGSRDPRRPPVLAGRALRARVVLERVPSAS